MEYVETDRVRYNCPKCSRRADGRRLSNGSIRVITHYVSYPHCSRDRHTPRIPCLFSGNRFELYYLDADLLDLQDLVDVPTDCPKNCDSKFYTVEKRNLGKPPLFGHLCAWRIKSKLFQITDLKLVPMERPRLLTFPELSWDWFRR